MYFSSQYQKWCETIAPYMGDCQYGRTSKFFFALWTHPGVKRFRWGFPGLHTFWKCRWRWIVCWRYDTFLPRPSLHPGIPFGSRLGTYILQSRYRAVSCGVFSFFSFFSSQWVQQCLRDWWSATIPSLERLLINKRFNSRLYATAWFWTWRSSMSVQRPPYFSKTKWMLKTWFTFAWHGHLLIPGIPNGSRLGTYILQSRYRAVSCGVFFFFLIFLISISSAMPTVVVFRNDSFAWAAVDQSALQQLFVR